MTKKLSDFSKGRDNNFNLIRFLAASFVLWGHSYSLSSGRSEDEPLVSTLGLSIGHISVDVFFVTSGFLIAASYYNRGSVVAFIWARLLRIFPALFVALGFCVFVVGINFTTLDPVDYVRDQQTLVYLLRNSVLFTGVEHQLPGVFESNPYALAVNGSLWTLPYEIRMYAYLLLIGSLIMVLERMLRLRLKRWVFFAVYISASALYITRVEIPVGTDASVRLFALFFAGSACYVFRDHVRISHLIFVSLLVALFLSASKEETFRMMYFLSLPYIILYLAYVPDGVIRRFNDIGDYSYGLYIYAFPIQQSVASVFEGIHASLMTLVSFPTALLLAALSWHLLERRCLSLKRHYLTIEQSFGRRNVRRSQSAD